jgi:hypothetical protein
MKGGFRGVMNVHVVRPPVSHLVFQLYAKPLHPELFDILATRTFQREDYSVTVRITRTGHVITWENRDVLLTEVAHEDQGISERRRLLNFRLRGDHNATFKCSHGVVYQTSFQIETLAPEIFLHIHDEILADGAKRGLLHNFQPNHRLNVAPLGHVSLETRAGCLFISCCHTYPEENAVVKSQTLIEVT